MLKIWAVPVPGIYVNHHDHVGSLPSEAAESAEVLGQVLARVRPDEEEHPWVEHGSRGCQLGHHCVVSRHRLLERGVEAPDVPEDTEDPEVGHHERGDQKATWPRRFGGGSGMPSSSGWV